MSQVKVGAEYTGRNSCIFTVWSPLASSVEVRIVYPGSMYIGLERIEEGYWRKEVDGIIPGARYLYRIDGRAERPDPASSFQPEGVHGPSEVVDHGSFRWSSSRWRVPKSAKMIIYEIHTGTYTIEGTFDAIIPGLNELKELGVSVIELMPVAQFPGERNWGYDGTYPYAVQNSYGGPEGLKRLINACHDAGMALFLDVVYNHLGPEGNYLSVFGPYFTGRYRTPWGDAVNFDGEYSDGVRNYFIMNALHWFENYNIDGLRLDAVHGIFDYSATHILEELADAVKSYSSASGRTCYLVAESDLNDSKIVKSKNRGGFGIDAQWSDDFHHSVHTLVTGESSGYYSDFGRIEHLVKAFKSGYVYTGEYSGFRKRRHGNTSSEIPGDKLIVCIQNHDQVGNRGFGERLISVSGFEAQKLAAGTLMIAPFIPLLFMGEEYGERAPFFYFISHGDPDLVEAVRKGRIDEFSSFMWNEGIPDPQDPVTFRNSRPDRKLICMAEHAAMYRYYRELIRLRRKIPALAKLSRDKLETGISGDGMVLTVKRRSGSSIIFAVMNYGKSENSISIGKRGENYSLLIDSADPEWNGPGASAPNEIRNRREIVLKPHNFILYSGRWKN